jgi:hypothetical protein
MNAIHAEVNIHLRADNGTGYLNMAYEEILFPVGFVGKKKYFGIPHEHSVNFRIKGPKDLFIRGIDVVKQGVPEYAKTVGYRIMMDAVRVDNRRSLRQIVEDVLTDAYNRPDQWKFEDFIRTATWKPHKQNVSVQKCIARMRLRHSQELKENETRVVSGLPRSELLFTIPEPGERFKYVIAKTGAQYDLHGYKVKINMGDRMEFAHAAKQTCLEVDIEYYMQRYVIGICARFINGDPVYQPPPEMAVAMTEKQIDEYAQKAAKKALTAYLKGLRQDSPSVSLKRGAAYRKAYNVARARAFADMKLAHGADVAGVLGGQWVDAERILDAYRNNESDPESAFVNEIFASAKQFAQYVVAWWRRDLTEAAAGVAAAKTGHTITVRNEAETAVRCQLRAISSDVRGAALAYEAYLERLVQECRREEHKHNPAIAADAGDTPSAGGLTSPSGDPTPRILSDTEQAALQRLRELWFRTTSLCMTHLGLGK